MDPLPGSTRPGTRLQFGDQAVITVGPDSDQSRVGVVVSGVEQGTPEDSTVLIAEFGDVLRTEVPEFTAGSHVYFIRGTLINEDGMNGGSYTGPLLQGDLEGGGDAGQLTLMGGDIVLPHCTVAKPPPEWNVRGARYEFCRIIFARPESVRLSIADGDIYWLAPSPSDSAAIRQ